MEEEVIDEELRRLAEEYAKQKLEVVDKDTSYYFFFLKQAYYDGFLKGKQSTKK